LDLAVVTIEDRFNQEGFKMLTDVEQMLLKACAGQNFGDLTTSVGKFFGDDFREDDLVAQLATRSTPHLQIIHTRFAV
jgi:hypothetical protein